MGVSDAAVAELRSRLLDPAIPISARYRALFSLRNLRGQGPREALEAAMLDPSCLLAHEAAFALGQQQDTEAVPALARVLRDVAGAPAMVRHEAAEALGAIGSADCPLLLQSSLKDDPAQEVRETCELALHRMDEQQQQQEEQKAMGSRQGDEGSGPADDGGVNGNPFLSVDPARPAPDTATTEALRSLLIDDGRPLPERYAALFALRNRRTPEAVEAVIAGLHGHSALLRHEVAYVLGQLQDARATDALVATLCNEQEHAMVRHEAAEALGAIADTSRGRHWLLKFQHDKDPVVAQSCEVALDMMLFASQEDGFEYADVNVGGTLVSREVEAAAA
eukprot:TRINITY_DN1149_c0_g1_i1.p1 TRINITY_DN1149_c0_g1~~TRINITY_DN1149_c0_g1_i1.p1  ORF type:complete len:336 (-),score=81.86 TRINITY_DN1149_c0_g1_i1:174-1181(-)